MGSTTSDSSGQSNTGVTIPKWLKPYYKNTANNLITAQGQLPSLSELYANTPLLGTAPLTSQQLTDIGNLQTLDPNNQTFQSGVSGLENFTGTGGGPSNATLAALQEFQNLTAPSIMQNAALMGQGNSGAALEALATGQEQALVPFMQQDLANQLTASQGLVSAGQGQFNESLQQMQAALQAAGMPQEIAQQQAQALFDQQQQQAALAGWVQSGGQGQFPSLLGSSTSQSGSTTTSQPLF